jgi:SNF2 family DNA or RNA helicase
MKKKHFSRRIPDGRPEGEVTLEGNLLRIAFTYSPARIEVIKKFPRARFHKESKSWTIPAKYLDLLEKSSLFSKERIDYRISTAMSAVSTEVTPEEKQAALAKVKENPFSVPKEAIDLLNLDVVIHLALQGGSLRCCPRFRSKSANILDKIQGAHLLKNERAYYMPILELNNFLKVLRDNNLSFAVEQAAGEQLTKTASKRASLLSEKGKSTAYDLSECLMTPFVDRFYSEEYYDGNLFTLHQCTSVQLKQLFPNKKNLLERKRLVCCFDEETLLRLITRAKSLGINIFQTEEVRRLLISKEEELSNKMKGQSSFNEAFLGLIKLPQCWIGEESGKAGLLVDKEFAEQKIDNDPTHPLTGFKRDYHSTFGDRYFYCIGESIILDVYNSLLNYTKSQDLEGIPESNAFQLLRNELVKREELLTRRRYYQELKDLNLSSTIFSNKEVTEKLFPHQRVAVQWLLEQKYAFLGDDMGLGKTLSVLAAFDALYEQGEANFLLVACPNSLTRNWVRECANWFPKRKLILLPSTKSEKIKFFKQLSRGDFEIDGLVLNYEALRLEYVFPEIEKLVSKKNTLLCMDESQRVKNHASKIFAVLSKIAPHASRRVLLSGTPTPKDITDIWAQMYLLDDGQRFGRKYYDWLSSIAELGNKYSEFAVSKLKPFAVRETVARIHEVLLRRKKEEVISLPEKTFSVRDVELSGDQLVRYEEIRQDLLLRVTAISGNTFVREIDSVLEEYLRAVQVASNPRLIDDSWQGEPAKFLELDQIVQEVVCEREEKLVIWTNYLVNVYELAERYKNYGTAVFCGEVAPSVREQTVKEFQEGRNLKILVAVPAAGGVGISTNCSIFR